MVPSSFSSRQWGYDVQRFTPCGLLPKKKGDLNTGQPEAKRSPHSRMPGGDDGIKLKEKLPSLLKPTQGWGQPDLSTLARPRVHCDHLGTSSVPTTSAPVGTGPSFTLWPRGEGTLSLPFITQCRAGIRHSTKMLSVAQEDQRGKKHRHLFIYSMSMYLFIFFHVHVFSTNQVPIRAENESPTLWSSQSSEEDTNSNTQVEKVSTGLETQGGCEGEGLGDPLKNRFREALFTVKLGGPAASHTWGVLG